MRVYLYVDAGSASKCHLLYGATGHTECPETEEYKDGVYLVYRCIYCHIVELNSISCMGITESGRRCKQINVDATGYCTAHPPKFITSRIDFWKSVRKESAKK